jgi:hypothetical protein
MDLKFEDIIFGSFVRREEADDQVDVGSEMTACFGTAHFFANTLVKNDQIVLIDLQVEGAQIGFCGEGFIRCRSDKGILDGLLEEMTGPSA